MRAPGLSDRMPGEHRVRGGHRRLLAPLTATVLFVIGLSLIGVAAASQQPPPPQAPSGSQVEAMITDEADLAASPPPSGSAPQSSTQPRTAANAPAGHISPERAAAPVRLRVPSIDVDTTLLHLGLDADQVLEVPHDPDLVGWFSLGTTPGDLGAAVMAGHVDSPQGRGVFFDLAEVPTGAEILVDREDGSTAVFRVDRVLQYPKDQLPTAEVYASTARELRLITCGGDWDGDAASYRDNIVVYATLVDSTD